MEFFKQFLNKKIRITIASNTAKDYETSKEFIGEIISIEENFIQLRKRDNSVVFLNTNYVLSLEII